ncbi:hypothetical protein [Plantibacter sp. CFBP 8804]|uniref:hypothetical protein n=1 Tax=Plantibacter sp. CFBP 8804 TaxID=2775270 RepID=UPI001781A1D4|nr:hypothetical protein [Plantibacter sp. CFBP 8804]MBD8518868.1 hypothetical protein [Plantibacter sp. CFBP 8804]
MPRDAAGELVAGSFNLRRPLTEGSPNAPWAVHLAGDDGRFYLLAFDFDGRDDEADERFDQVDAFRRLLDELMIEHVLCRSSSSDRRHVWVAIDRTIGADSVLVHRLGETAKQCYGTLDWGMMSNLRTGACRPPLSPHYNGSSSVVLEGQLEWLLDASTSLEQLRSLLDRLSAQVPERQEYLSLASRSAPVSDTELPSGRRPLTELGESFMGAAGGGADPSVDAYQCLLSALYAGWSLGDVAGMVRTAPGLEHYRTRNLGNGRRRPRNERDTRTRLERDWIHARNTVRVRHQAFLANQRTAPPKPARRTAAQDAELHAVLADVEWILDSFRITPGRWGGRHGETSDRHVLMALAYLTLHTGKRTIAASTRTLATMTNTSHTTVGKALARITARGFIRPVAPASGTNAALWELMPRHQHLSTGSDSGRPQPLQEHAPPPPLFEWRTASLNTLEAELVALQEDIFSHQGLGVVAGRLFGLLTRGATISVESAAALLGISALQTAHLFSRLKKHHLVTYRNGSLTHTRRKLLGKVAEALGVTGVLERRRQRFQRDRDLWAWFVDDLTQAAIPPSQRRNRTKAAQPTLVFLPTLELSDTGYPTYPRVDGSSGLRDTKQAASDYDAGYLDHIFGKIRAA